MGSLAYYMADDFFIPNPPLSERLTSLNLYSVQRRRERYIIIYVWKMLESKVLNFNPPIISLWDERRGRTCFESHIASGHLVDNHCYPYI